MKATLLILAILTFADLVRADEIKPATREELQAQIPIIEATTAKADDLKKYEGKVVKLKLSFKLSASQTPEGRTLLRAISRDKKGLFNVVLVEVPPQAEKWAEKLPGSMESGTVRVDQTIYARVTTANPLKVVALGRELKSTGSGVELVW